MRTFLLLTFLLLPLAACGIVLDVHLKHPYTGKTVVCEGKSGFRVAGRSTGLYSPLKRARAVREQDRCLQDYYDQGYRISGHSWPK